MFLNGHISSLPYIPRKYILRKVESHINTYFLLLHLLQYTRWDIFKYICISANIHLLRNWASWYKCFYLDQSTLGEYRDQFSPNIMYYWKSKTSLKWPLLFYICIILLKLLTIYYFGDKIKISLKENQLSIHSLLKVLRFTPTSIMGLKW